MPIQLQSSSTVLSVSPEKTEPLTAIKNEPLESEIGIDDIPNSLGEEIIPDTKDIDIVSHVLSEDLIKSESISKNAFENDHSRSLDTQVFVKTENIPVIKTENITQSEYLYKTQDTSDGIVSKGTSQGVIEVQGSNEHFNALQSDEHFVNFFKDLSDSRKAKCLNKTDISECYETVGTTSCEKDRKKGMVIEVPVIPIESHKYTSLVKAKHACNKNKSTHEQNKKRYCCEKCTFISENYSCFKRHKLSHKIKAEVDGRDLKYRCDKCKYKTCWPTSFKRHKLIHLKPEQIPNFYCYHCSYKSIRKANLQRHIVRHFKNKNVPFHCYICDFVTPRRDLIIEHFKTHPKHHSKCDETDYKNQLETYTKKQMRYCCEKCTYTSGTYSNIKLHQVTHKPKAEIDDRLLKYRCHKCKYKTCWPASFKAHKLTHLRPEEIQYFYCYHCPYKCKVKSSLKIHIFNHFKNEDVQFHCYICDFTTLKRNLIIEHFKKHPKHHSKCDETDYKNQLKIPYFYCYHCSYKCKRKDSLRIHIFSHFKRAEIPFHCYICDFVTLKRDLIIEHFKKHPKHHSKCDEIDYKNQLEIPYFYCYHCSYKCTRKDSLIIHIFSHFKREEIPFHCYICDFVTLKGDLIIEHFKKHPKHHSKCDVTNYKNQLESYTMRYRCKKCSFRADHYARLKLHELTHKTEAEMDDRFLKYRCNNCKYKTFRSDVLKVHKLTHLKPE